MKLTFKMSGGFAYIPALSKSVIIDTDQIDPEVADQLRLLVQESHFFDQPATIHSLPKGAADYLIYTITLVDSSRAHTLQRTDPIADANLARLVSFLEGKTRPSTLNE
jgi:hypothetical protein